MIYICGMNEGNLQMKIHEYQAKELFRKYGVPTPQGRVAFSPDEAVEVAKTLGGYPVVVKAQIHAGGRGQGGGVKLAQSEQEVERIASVKGLSKNVYEIVSNALI